MTNTPIHDALAPQIADRDITAGDIITEQANAFRGLVYALAFTAPFAVAATLLAINA